MHLAEYGTTSSLTQRRSFFFKYTSGQMELLKKITKILPDINSGERRISAASSSFAVKGAGKNQSDAVWKVGHTMSD